MCNINKFAALFFVTVVAFVFGFVAFASSVEAAKKVKVDYFVAKMLEEPKQEESGSWKTFRCKCLVDDREVLIEEKVQSYTDVGSGIWVFGMKVAGANERKLGEHFFKIIDLETKKITYFRIWTIDEKGRVKTADESVPEVTYVREE